MKPTTPITEAAIPIPDAAVPTCPAVTAERIGHPDEERLMPFGAAAKAIFVKANGLPAYHRSLRYARRAD